MKKLPKISDAEYQVMKIVWKDAPISTNEVIEILIKTSQWSPKTIQTLLLRLVKKGVLSYKKDSRVFIYTPILLEEDYLAQESSSFLNRFYGGTLNSMVLHFIEQEKLVPKDIDELRRILDERQKKGGE